MDLIPPPWRKTAQEEYVGFSVEEARDAEGKRRGQKREGRIFDMLPGSNMTFEELAKWYLNLASVQRLSRYDRVVSCLANFNKVFGNRNVNGLRPEDLEEYQALREKKGVRPATIDMELSRAQSMVTKAFDNDKVDGKPVKAFRRIKPLLRRGSNARDRLLGFDEYLKLTDEAGPNLKAILKVSMNTGMRRGEMVGLRWSHIDREKGFIRLPAEVTKERKPKMIPINHHVEKALDSVPRALHHDFVFTFRGNAISGDLRTSLRAACKTAGISYGMYTDGGFRLHDLRTTVKTNMLRAGVDKVYRDAILGHSLQGMDVYYLKPTEEDLKRAMDRYTSWLDEQLAIASEKISDVAQTLPKTELNNITL